MKKIVQKAGEELRNIKNDMNNGIISMNEAKDKAIPYLEIINNEGKLIAKKFGKKYYPLELRDIKLY